MPSLHGPVTNPFQALGAASAVAGCGTAVVVKVFSLGLLPNTPTL